MFAPPRHLLHVQHDMLVAEEFDSSTWQLTGRATVLARGVSPPSLADGNVVSAAGDLIAYRGGVRQQQLAWVDRAGEVLATLPMPAVMFNPRVSPDGSHLLATGSVTTNPGLWLASLTRTEYERIETDAIAPLWSPDGARIAFTARGGFDLLIRPSSGAGSRRLISSGIVKILNDWSPERRSHHLLAARRADTARSLGDQGRRRRDVPDHADSLQRAPSANLAGRTLARLRGRRQRRARGLRAALSGARRTIQGVHRRGRATAMAPRSERAVLHRVRSRTHRGVDHAG